MKKRTVVSETYNYNGIDYTLNFDVDDTTGTPTNTSTEDSLLNAIGSNSFYLEYKYEDQSKIFITDNSSPGTFSEETTALAPPECMYAEFYENSNFGGNSFCADSRFKRQGYVITNNNLCAEVFGDNNLGSRSFPGGGNWEDKISSFKMFQSGSTKTYYDNNGYSGNHTSVAFCNTPLNSDQRFS